MIHPSIPPPFGVFVMAIMVSYLFPLSHHVVLTSEGLKQNAISKEERPMNETTAINQTTQKTQFGWKSESQQISRADKTEKNHPIQKYRAGSITATIWENKKQFEGKEVSYYSVSLDRRYQDKAGAWQSTNNYRIQDLPKAELVLRKAYEYITLNPTGESSDVSAESYVMYPMEGVGA